MKPEPAPLVGDVAEAPPEARGEESTAKAPSHRPTVAPGIFLTAVIAGVLAMGLAIYWLLRSMRV